jgi:hypothetical protein
MLREDIHSWEQILHNKAPTVTGMLDKKKRGGVDLTLSLYLSFSLYSPLPLPCLSLPLSLPPPFPLPLLQRANVAPYLGEHKRIWKPPIVLNDWSEISNQRKFFDNFAKEHGFDPLVPENWYDVERKDIFMKVYWKFLSFFLFLYTHLYCANLLFCRAQDW